MIRVGVGIDDVTEAKAALFQKLEVVLGRGEDRVDEGGLARGRRADGVRPAGVGIELMEDEILVLHAAIVTIWGGFFFRLYFSSCRS
jgi:hypothetical protein